MTITLPEVDSEVDAAIEQLITDLANARDYIAKHGLAKNMYVSVLTNAACTDGALMRAIGPGAARGPRHPRALHALASTIGADLSEKPAAVIVHEFNDAPGTEKADVISLFNTTIDRLR